MSTSKYCTVSFFFAFLLQTDNFFLSLLNFSFFRGYRTPLCDVTWHVNFKILYCIVFFSPFFCWRRIFSFIAEPVPFVVDLLRFWMGTVYLCVTSYDRSTSKYCTVLFFPSFFCWTGTFCGRSITFWRVPYTFVWRHITFQPQNTVLYCTVSFFPAFSKTFQKIFLNWLKLISYEL